MISFKEFLSKFIEQFDLLEANETLEGGTYFQDLDSWDSLTALMVLAMIDDNFSVDYSGDDLLKCKTIEEVYNKIVDRQINDVGNS